MTPPPSATKAPAIDLDVIKDCAECPELVVVPAGSYAMGSEEGDQSEQPRHRVNIDRPFAIGRYEVTLAQWKACVDDGGCKYMPDKDGMAPHKPVFNVSWVDAQQYVDWLSKKTGKDYRLPSEAEWEYAARAGTSTSYWWGDSIGTGNANCNKCGGEWDRVAPAEVDAHAPNPFGIYGMNGGVWEWSSDCWFDDHKGAPADGSVRDKPNCRSRVLRGGSWRNDASYARSASRFTYDHDVRYVLNGFRVARSVE